MSRIRVLVVDDSVVVRKVVSDALASDSEIEVVGTASNGKLAIQKIEQVNPDIITMDIEMPEMDGLAALKAIRKTHPRLPVIMFSTLTERAASATLDALSLGANDYVTKPTGLTSPEMVGQHLRQELVSKVRMLAGRRGTGSRAESPAAGAAPSRSAVRPATRASSGQISAVVLGVSTGGPNALADLVPSFPANFPVPVLIVQHMPPLFTRLLAERLASRCALPVREGVPGEAVLPGRVYIAPGDWHMEVTGTRKEARLVTQKGPPENSCRPAADVLFRSAVQVYGSNILAVVLTGMGRDGLRGVEKIVEAGGQVLAQDEATSVVWGMPGFVAQAGLADEVLPLSQVGPAIVRRVTARAAREAACL